MEDEEGLGHKEGDTPEEHGLGDTEQERQVLEPVDVVPAFGEVSIL